MKKSVVPFIAGFLVATVMLASAYYRPHRYYGMYQAYGTWYGIHEIEHGLLSAIYRLNEDGTFEIDFVRYNKGCALRSKSTVMGVWGLDQSTFFMIEQKRKIKGGVESINPKKRGINDAFSVLELDENDFIFAREKPWLRPLDFSSLKKFRAFRTKDALKRHLETNVSAQWSACTNLMAQ